MINKIILGHALTELSKLPSELVNCCITSPPYWGLRDYGIEQVIWDGNKDCDHNFSIETKAGDIRFRGKNSIVGSERNPKVWEGDGKGQFCLKCGCWRGSLGLEPTFELYIKHLCDIFDEVKRVLRKDGTCWVNIGDSYGGFQGKNAGWPDSKTRAKVPQQLKPKRYAKSLLDIPYRFSIEMTNRGWIKRNTIIWWKPNCMPSSADDRFTVDFEYLFFFTRNNKTLFWTNEKTLECVDKKPLGTKGVEGIDWEWRKIGENYENYNTKISREDAEKYNSLKARKYRNKEWKKVSLWTGRDYWFEQQFEKYAPDTLPRMDRGMNVNKWTFGADGQTPHNLSQPRLNKKRGYKTKQPEKEIQSPQYHGKDISYGKQGRNKRCVWEISTKSFKEAHFATFPETLIEPIIKAGCPEFVCENCGKARVKIYEIERYATRPGNKSKYEGMNIDAASDNMRKRVMNNRDFIGHTDCGCNAGFEGGIILDPFMGAGTTALVALKQSKRFIGIEIKQEYIDLAYKRIAKVQQEIF